MMRGDDEGRNALYWIALVFLLVLIGLLCAQALAQEAAHRIGLRDVEEFVSIDSRHAADSRAVTPEGAPARALARAAS